MRGSYHERQGPTRLIPDLPVSKFVIPDIPTAVTYEEAMCLHSLAKGKRVLEFGSLLGFSTIILAQAAELVVAVDPHEGYPIADPKPTFTAFHQHLKTFGVEDKVIPIVTKGHKAIEILKNTFDLCFIDMDSETYALWNLADELGCEIIAMHDYGHPQWHGTTDAVTRLTNTGVKFTHKGSLAISGYTGR